MGKGPYVYRFKNQTFEVENFINEVEKIVGIVKVNGQEVKVDLFQVVSSVLIVVAEIVADVVANIVALLYVPTDQIYRVYESNVLVDGIGEVIVLLVKIITEVNGVNV